MSTRLPFSRRQVCILLSSYNLELNLVTLVLDFDVGVSNIYLPAKMKFLGQGFRKWESEQETQTLRHDNITTSHLRVIIALSIPQVG